MRIDEILGATTADLLLRVLPAQDRPRARRTSPRAARARAARARLRVGHLRRRRLTREKTLEIVSRIKDDFGLEAMAHFTCVNATIDELRAHARPDARRRPGERAGAARRPAGRRGRWTKTEGGLEYSRELIELLARRVPRVRDRRAPRSRRPTSTRPRPRTTCATSRTKVDAGVGFLVTQLFFDNAYYFAFVERARALGIDVPIIPGIMPITSVDEIKRMTSLSGSDRPRRWSASSRRAGRRRGRGRLGVAYATLQCADLLAGGAPGIHFYTLNRSPATRAILSALKLMRPWKVGQPLPAR